MAIRHRFERVNIMTEHTRLNPAQLKRLPSSIRLPGYDRNRLAIGIVHIGIGGFHRAHQALYLDDLFGQRGPEPWAVCGVGLLAQDSRMAEALRPQAGLYTLIERGEGAAPPRVIGSLTEYLHAPSESDPVLNRLTDPATRVVSLTVTEGGYFQDQGAGELEADHPDLRHDLAHPGQPKTVYGYLSEALARRRETGIAPFTVLSCDNLQHNGDVVREMLCTFARLRDPGLSAWMEEQVAFPNSMVDRITPATTDADRAQAEQLLGLVDAWPVVAEPFRQWVIEDRFCNGRPELEAVGVQMTDDVDPYELMKIRLLNASHQALGYLGVLAGHEYVDEAMRDPLFDTLVSRYMAQVRPLIAEPPGVDLEQYQRTLRVRFANPAIKDTLARLCFDGSARMPKFVLPSLREQLARSGSIELFALIVAGWCRYLAGRDEQGRSIRIEDALADTLQARVRFGDPDPRPFLGLRQLFGDDLGRSETVVNAVRRALDSLYRKGARATLADYLPS